MRELSLFSGAGGGLLGTKLLGWEHIGYVEYNEYCQKVIKQRIKDGILDEAPIFGDIRAFIDQGYADSYQGMVDVVTAGFPCQPFSVAGKQKGEDDERNMWPQTLEVIRRVRPRFTFLENVPGLLAHPYARRIFGDLAESGFDARWRVLSAAEMGAPHERGRLWVLAINTNSLNDSSIENGIGGKIAESESFSGGKVDRERKNKAPNTSSKGLEGQQLPIRAEQKYSTTSNTCWWEIEPDVGRVANGVASRVDRLKAIGNGQVSSVVRAAWNLLSE